MRALFDALKKSVSDFLEDDCMSSGAAIAYYTIFSLPPLLILVVMLATNFGYSPERVSSVVKKQLGMPATDALSATQADQTQEQGGSDGAMSQIQGVGNLGLVSKLVGLVILIFSATGVFAQLQYSLNRAWEVEPDPKQGGVMSFLFKRLLSMGMIVVIAFLLLVSLVVSTVVDEIVNLAGGAPDAVTSTLAVVLNQGVSFGLATLLFAAMYKILPDARMRWRDVWVGAGFTAALFVLGQFLISLYLEHTNLGTGWGNAAGSMIAVLVWVYYSALILLLGAEVAQVWANQYGSGIQPANGAVKAVEEKHFIREGGKKELASGGKSSSQ